MADFNRGKIGPFAMSGKFTAVDKMTTYLGSSGSFSI